MERVPLTVEMREPGKGPARRMRTEGRIPGVLYGRTVKPVTVSVDRRQLEKITKTKAGMNVMIDLSVAGGDSGLALIRDYQADPFKREFTHVDFQAITLKEKIEVEVPIVLTGESVGVKEGGIIEQLRRTLHIKSLPTAIPEKIEIDITSMKIGDSVHSNELTLPQGVEFASATIYTIVAIVPPTKEEVAAPVAAAPEAVAEGAAPAEGAAVPAEGAAATPAEGAAAAPAEGAAAAPAAKGGKKEKKA